jgi:ribosome-binding ATPase YchF (GTP1/OBG family)
MRELGSVSEARTQGRLRLEGKEYVVQDGDIITVRFNV